MIAPNQPAFPVDIADDQEALRQVVAFYHERLKRHAQAQAYLQSRGLNHPELIDRFHIGFADRELGRALPSKQVKAGHAIRERFEQLGINRASGHGHFNGCIVFPIFDAAGNIADIYGRKIGKALRKGTALHVRLPAHLGDGRWNMDSADVANEIIICDSIINALTFWCAGYRNVTACFDGVTHAHVDAFRQREIRRVLIGFRRTDEGDATSEQLGDQLTAAGLDAFRIYFPQGTDANDFALASKSPADALGQVIENAQWTGKAPVAVTTPATNGETKPAAPDAIDAEITPAEIVMEHGERRYRVRGLARNMSYEVLKINLLASRGDAFHVDTFDLYAARPRASFIKQAADELGCEQSTIKKDVGNVLLKLEQLQDQQISAAIETKDAPAIADKEAALELLNDPDLIDRILADFDRCGVVGEELNKLTCYVATISRKLHRPLAVMIQSSSAAGKSSLMDAVLAFVPPEEQVRYSAMTGQSLYYMGETSLKHRVLAIAEEEGVEQAAYALKLLQSEGELTIASTGKDSHTGRMETKEYRVAGPVMILLTTTSMTPDDELLNRCITLCVNEDRQQTQAIHRLQRQGETLDGLLARRERERVLQLHQDAQRLLRPLEVVNPYAEQLTFIDEKTRTRRDHVKYLTLIRAVTLLHQYQRPIRKRGEIEYIESTPADIEIANRLAREVLIRGVDDLPPRTRQLLADIEAMVSERCRADGLDRCDFRFTRRDVRDYTQLGNTQLKTHLRRLEDMEYVERRGGGRGGHKIVYELTYVPDFDGYDELVGAKSALSRV